MGFANPRGGLQASPDGQVPRVLKVTTLADSGPGSLREAVDASGPRLIVFEVSGVIRLESDLKISKPYVTIAGQTAPGHGVSLYHERLLIKTHDVVVQHIRVRPGDRHSDGSPVTAGEAENRDAIGIGTGSGVEDVTIDHVSVSWCLDSLIDTWYPAKRIDIRNSILAEPLALTAHPDTSGGVPHNYALGIGYRSHDISIVGNLIAHADRRSPRFGKDSSVVVLNNTIYDPGHMAIHLQDSLDQDHRDVAATIIGNHVETGPTTIMDPPRHAVFNLLTGGTSGMIRLHHRDNTTSDPAGSGFAEGSSATPATILPNPPIWDETLVEMTAEERREHSLYGVGARPTSRDATDHRIVLAYASGTGGPIDSQDEVGGYPDLCTETRPLTPPTDLLADSDSDGIADGVTWLKQYTDEVV